MTFKDPNTTTIPVTVDSLDAVDENLRGIYAETTDGKFQIRADIAFQSDFEKVRDTLAKERTSNKDLTSKVKDLQSRLDAYGGIDAVAVKGMQNELANLKSTETDLVKIQSAKAELELKLNGLQDQFNELTQQNKKYEAERAKNRLRDGARRALVQNGIEEMALEDGLIWAERCLELAEDGSIRVKDGDNSVYPAGISVDSWATIFKKNKPYYFGGSVGGGAGGSNTGSSPIDNWTNTGVNGGVNITKLMLAIREDPKAVRAVAKTKGIDLSRYAYMFPKDE